MIDSPRQDLHGEERWPFRPTFYNRKPSTGRMERVLKKMNISGAQYKAWTGGQPLNRFGADNPGWTQRAWEVLIVENAEHIRSIAPAQAASSVVGVSSGGSEGE